MLTMESKKVDLTIGEVAEYAGCHPNTIRNLERSGYINPLRDRNNNRRFTKGQAERVRELINLRRPFEN